MLRQNFNALIAALHINLTRLGQYINYDPSALFRIRNGSRKPSDSEQFASAVALFVSREMNTSVETAAVADLIGCKVDETEELSARCFKIKSWLLKQPPQGNKKRQRHRIFE